MCVMWLPVLSSSSPSQPAFRNIGTAEKGWEASKEARGRRVTHIPLPLICLWIPCGYVASVYYPCKEPCLRHKQGEHSR